MNFHRSTHLQACRCHLHSCGEAQSQAEALDGQVAHRVGGQCQQRAVACLVAAASQLERFGLDRDGQKEDSSADLHIQAGYRVTLKQDLKSLNYT